MSETQFNDMPKVRGELKRNIALSKMTWLGVGGLAEFLFFPADLEDLTDFLRACDPRYSIFPFGVGSNLIVRDGGLDGVVVRLGRGFNKIVKMNETHIYAGAAALDGHVGRRAGEWGIDLSFLSTIPGTIGGGIAMNAGCYGRYVADVVRKVTIVNRFGVIEHKKPEDLAFSYRFAQLDEGSIVIGAVLEGVRADSVFLQEKIAAQITKRNATQPCNIRSAGSAFRNPAGFSSTNLDGDMMEKKAWTLIEKAGLRGLRVGDAQISEKHTNFMVNRGEASAADFEKLGEEVIKRVLQTTGIRLEWEIVRIGKANALEV